MTCSTAIFIFIGLALCDKIYAEQETSAPVVNLMDSISNVANTPGLNETAMQQIENVKEKLKEKCEKNGGSYDKLLVAKDDLEICLKGLLDVNKLQDEIEQAKPFGDLDSVFQKYCMKNVTLLKCMTDFISVFDTCITPEDRENLRILPNITKSFLNFICHKEGDRIALFIAAGGPECFREKQVVIQDCFNHTFSSHLPAFDANTTPDFETFPSIVFNLQQCNSFSRFQDCTVKELEKCTDPTPGNMADALLTFVKNATPCHDILQGRANAVLSDDLSSRIDSSASSVISASTIIVIATSVLLKYV